MSLRFLLSAAERLQEFLFERGIFGKIELLTPDASTREYFRINWNGSTAIACVYPESFAAKEQNYLDATKLFLAAGLPVAEIYDFDGERGVIVQEDFGNRILRDFLNESNAPEKENLINQAISLIARIQAATPIAFDLNSIASQLKFDEEKLIWELNFFKIHYFESLQKKNLSSSDEQLLTEEFTKLSRELAARAEVLCHRDFHSANLMIDRQNRLCIIDHQDARIGAASYDLVSLLLDRISEMPAESWLNEKKRFFLSERKKLNLGKIDFEIFDYEFQLQTVQRCLKAIGTFSFQSSARGKIHFIKYIEPMFRSVLEACRQLKKFPQLQKIIKEQISSK